MTYDELIELMLLDDPLIDRDDSYSVSDKGLIVLGQTGETAESCDLRVVIEPCGSLRAWMRDPEGLEDSFHGREWAHMTLFEPAGELETKAQLVDRLRNWVYTW